MYLLFTILPLIFHDFAWSTIAYLRYLNVTDNESWLEIDQEKLRSRTSFVTWAATAVTLAILLPVGHHLIEIDFRSNTEDLEYIIIDSFLFGKSRESKSFSKLAFSKSSKYFQI